MIYRLDSLIPGFFITSSLDGCGVIALALSEFEEGLIDVLGLCLELRSEDSLGIVIPKTKIIVEYMD